MPAESVVFLCFLGDEGDCFSFSFVWRVRVQDSGAPY